MDSKQLDSLFQEGLSRPMRFQGAEAQWQMVYDELLRDQSTQDNKKRRLLGFWILGAILLLGFSFWYTQAFSTVESNSPTSLIPATFEQPTMLSKAPRVDWLFTPQASTLFSSERPFVSTSEVRQAPPLLYQLEVNALFLPNPIQIDSSLTPTKTKEAVATSKLLPTLVGSPLIASRPPLPIGIERINKITLTIPSIQQTINTPQAGLALTPVANQTPKGKRLGISAGTTTNWIATSDVTDTLRLQGFVGLDYRLHGNWCASLTYSQTHINRSFSGGPNRFELPLSPPPYLSDAPDFTSLSYRSRQIDMALDYTWLKTRRFYTSGLVGLRISQRSRMDGQLTYDTPYQPEVISVTSPASSWAITQVFVGLQLNVTLTPALSLQTRYQHFTSLPNSQAKWSNTQQLSLGLRYAF